jgi:hypothetical protein
MIGWFKIGGTVCAFTVGVSRLTSSSPPCWKTAFVARAKKGSRWAKDCSGQGTYITSWIIMISKMHACFSAGSTMKPGFWQRVP